jgi:hypothetical protein
MTQDDAGSAPMLGSQPVAWSVGNPARVSSRTRSVSVHPQRKWAQASARHNGRSEEDIVPLYLAPQTVITADEMRAIHWAAEMMEVGSLPNSLNRDDAAKLRGLLERLG